MGTMLHNTTWPNSLQFFLITTENCEKHYFAANSNKTRLNPPLLKDQELGLEKTFLYPWLCNGLIIPSTWHKIQGRVCLILLGAVCYLLSSSLQNHKFLCMLVMQKSQLFRVWHIVIIHTKKYFQKFWKKGWMFQTSSRFSNLKWLLYIYRQNSPGGKKKQLHLCWYQAGIVYQFIKALTDWPKLVIHVITFLLCGLINMNVH